MAYSGASALPMAIPFKERVFNNPIASEVRKVFCEVKRNPKDFFTAHYKTISVALIILSSLYYSPILTAGSALAGAFFNKKVTKVENEFLELIYNYSLEFQIISGGIFCCALFSAAPYILPSAIGFHMGMLFGQSYEPYEQIKSGTVVGVNHPDDHSTSKQGPMWSSVD